MLKRAAELYEKDGSSDDKILETYQQILRLDPQDEGTRELLEARYLRANRHRDVTRLLEQALTTDPPPTEEYALKVRARLIELYAGQLHEPERSMPHIEALLAREPSHDEARRVATKLLEVKGLAARAAGALAAAHDQAGDPADVERFLAIELEHTRGPKRRDVLRKIGVLRQDRTGEAAGAYDAFEAALALDPADDDTRSRYAALAKKLGKELDAARTLSRVGAAVKDGEVRAKVTADVGALYLAGGDAKRAKATLVGVLAMHDLTPAVTLVASRALCSIHAAEKDYPALADSLERVAVTEPDPELRQIANEELAELATETLKDSPRAIDAYRRLLDTPARGRALAALEPLYEASGDTTALAGILEERARDAGDPDEARRIAFRAAEVMASTSDGAAASAAWRKVVDNYGAARDVHERWIPLLEAQRQWAELATALDADARLAPEAERPAILARLGAVRLQKTREVPLAIDAFRRALEVDSGEKTSRATLDKLLSSGDHRLAAAAVLEPIVRAEGANAALLKILDLKAQLASDPDARLAALAEGVSVVERGEAGERTRGLDFVARGLAEAVEHQRPLHEWLEWLARFIPKDSDPKRRAAVLGRALGQRTIDSQLLVELAKETGDALAASGEGTAALEVYRRALAFEPASSELLNRVDDLLRDQGDPARAYRAVPRRAGAKAGRRPAAATSSIGSAGSSGTTSEIRRPPSKRTGRRSSTIRTTAKRTRRSSTSIRRRSSGGRSPSCSRSIWSVPQEKTPEARISPWLMSRRSRETPSVPPDTCASSCRMGRSQRESSRPSIAWRSSSGTSISSARRSIDGPPRPRTRASRARGSTSSRRSSTRAATWRRRSTSGSAPPRRLKRRATTTRHEGSTSAFERSRRTTARPRSGWPTCSSASRSGAACPSSTRSCSRARSSLARGLAF